MADMTKSVKINSKYELVVFDLDGTLVDSDLALIKIGLELSKHFLIKQNVNIDDLLYINGPSLNESMPILFPNTDVGEIREKYYEFAVDSIKDMTLFKDVTRVFETLKDNKIRIAIFTSRHRASSEAILKKFGLASYVTLLVAGGDNFKPKPSGEGLKYIYDKLDVKANKVLFVGDNWRDALAGSDAGVDVAFIKPHRRKMTIAISAKYELNDLGELLEVINE